MTRGAARATASSQIEQIRAALSRRHRRALPLDRLQPAAVTVPVVPGPGQARILFTVRTHRVEHHKGEISFPGGRVDPGDPGSLATALRETWEEVGIRPDHLDVLGPLDDFVSSTGFRVTPHAVALRTPEYPLLTQPAEVKEVLLVPVAHLRVAANRRTVLPPDSPYPIHHFRWGAHVIWGMTAAIAKHFVEIAWGGASS